jgi:peroxiredoxin
MTIRHSLIARFASTSTLRYVLVCVFTVVTGGVAGLVDSNIALAVQVESEAISKRYLFAEELLLTQGRTTRKKSAELKELPPEVLNASHRSTTDTPIKLADYRGKVLVLTLWATWCGPCTQQIEQLVEQYHEFRDKGLEVVGLTTEDPDSTVENVRQTVQDLKIDYRVGWANREVAAALMQGRDSIPQTFIISRDGKILKRFIGFSPVATSPQMKQAIEDALKG